MAVSGWSALPGVFVVVTLHSCCAQGEEGCGRAVVIDVNHQRRLYSRQLCCCPCAAREECQRLHKDRY